MIAAARWRGSSWPRRGCPCGSPWLPGSWRCSCASFEWIEPRHRLQVTSCHPRITRGRRRPWVRRWPQAVCSRSVSHRWMGCRIEDLHRPCQGLTGAGLSQTCPESCCRGRCPGGEPSTPGPSAVACACDRAGGSVTHPAETDGGVPRLSGRTARVYRCGALAGVCSGASGRPGARRQGPGGREGEEPGGYTHASQEEATAGGPDAWRAGWA